MNILMLISSLDCGGAESHVVSLAAELCRRGNRVTVASGGGCMTAELEKSGARHIQINFAQKHPMALLVSFVKLKKVVRDGRFDVIHAHSRIPAFLCHILRVRGAEYAVVTTVHARFRSGIFLRRLSFWGNHVISVSEDLRQYLSDEYGVCADNITVIPNGIDTEKFSVPPVISPAAGRRVVFMSRLDGDCSLAARLLCAAAFELAHAWDGFEIVIAGGGNSYAEIAELAKEENARIGYKCISLVGSVDKPEELLRQNSGAVFVGVSRAALEAALCGLDVILAGNEGYGGILTTRNFSDEGQSNFCCRGREKPTSEMISADIHTLLSLTDVERKGRRAALTEQAAASNGILSCASYVLGVYRKAIQNTSEIRCSREKSDIVLCGYYGFGNTGDDAVLSGALIRVRSQHPGKGIAVLAHSPLLTERRHRVFCVRRENVFLVMRTVKKAGLLVFGGGSVLQDKTSLRSLICYSSLIFYAKKHGVCVELWANGLGPFKNGISRSLARSALRCCEHIGVRDETAASLALSLGTSKEKIVVEKDLSFIIPPCSAERGNFIVGRLGLAYKKFGAFAFSNVLTEDAKVYFTIKLSELKKKGVIPLIIPMFPARDIRICRDIANRSGALLCSSLTPAELISVLNSAVFVVSTRYHLPVFASRASIPFVGIGDDPKITAVNKEAKKYASENFLKDFFETFQEFQ